MNSIIEKVVAYIALVIYLWGGFQYLFSHSQDKPLYRLLFVLLTLVGGLILIRIFAKKYGIIVKRYQINRDIENIKTQSTPVSFEKVLPKKQLLERWMDSADKKAAAWAHDAIKTSTNFYIDVKPSAGFGYTLQAIYYSAWKKEQLTVYEGSSSNQNVEDDLTTYDKTAEIPFFKKYRKWKKAILVAYESKSTNMPTPFSLQITQSSGELRVNFSYKANGKDMKERFAYNGSVLTDSRSKTSVTV